MGIESIYLQYTYDERTKGRRKEFYICIKGAKKKNFNNVLGCGANRVFIAISLAVQGKAGHGRKIGKHRAFGED